MTARPPLWENLRVLGPLHRLLSLAVLLLWAAPSLAAATTALHVALDHRGAHDAEHQGELAELARAVTHGHHHDVAPPEHEHDASLTAPAPLPKRFSSAVVVPALPVPLVRGERSRPEIASRRGPPRPLFTSHCSLLL